LKGGQCSGDLNIDKIESTFRTPPWVKRTRVAIMPHSILDQKSHFNLKGMMCIHSGGISTYEKYRSTPPWTGWIKGSHGN
jgi:hypothetical protein